MVGTQSTARKVHDCLSPAGGRQARLAWNVNAGQISAQMGRRCNDCYGHEFHWQTERRWGLLCSTPRAEVHVPGQADHYARRNTEQQMLQQYSLKLLAVE